MCYSTLKGQKSMALDKKRNRAYFNALSKIIKTDSVVLDLGAGLGLLGFFSAKLGAKKVYLVEPENIIGISKEIALNSDWSEKIEFVQGKVEDISLPEKVDVIISVFTGNFLLTEDLLPFLFHTRRKFLKDDGILIPESASMMAVPITSASYYKDTIEIWSKPHLEIDLSICRNYANNTVFYPRNELRESIYLSNPKEILNLDFYTADNISCKSEVQFKINQTELCHGICGWFDMRLGKKWFSTDPHKSTSHWSPAFLPLDPPVKVKKGDNLNLQISRMPYGEWNWSIGINDNIQKHSTFYSLPLTSKSITKASLDFKPKISEKGNAAMYVLSNLDASNSIKDIAQGVTRNYPDSYNDLDHAIEFVRNIIKWAA